MGFLNNIKKILFEEEPEEGVNVPPDYSKEEKEPEVERVSIPVDNPVEEPIKVTDDSRFKIKRDLEPEFDDQDILDEVPSADDKDFEIPDIPSVKEVPEEKNNNIFQSFDEQEFERSYSRLTKNENRVQEKKEEPEVKTQVQMDSYMARKANSNISSTESKVGDGPKKFKPSPVLSPVFGVLNVNYTKEDIVDRKGGIKREKVSPIVKKKTEEVVKEVKKAPEKVEVNIDMVRKKAYGAIEDLEKTAQEETKEDIKVDNRNDFTSVELDKSKKEKEVIETKEVKEVEEIKEEVNVPEKKQIEEEQFVDEVSYDDNEDDEVADKPVVLDELEKTSTLQILDDIEKELNAIKPIKKDELKEEVEDRTPSIENSDTLENDLFNLIDSMYETDKEEK